MAEMPNCRVCGKTLVFANGLYCSNKCYHAYLEREAQPVPEPVVSDRPATNEGAEHNTTKQISNDTPAISEPPELPVNVVPLVIAGTAARQCRATPERIQTILADIALGLDEQEACAVSGVNPRTWLRWKRMSKVFPTLSAHAAGIRKKKLLTRKAWLVENKLDWKEAAWDLERRFGGEFADPAKATKLYIGAQQINYAPSEEKVREIEARRQASLARLEAGGIIGNGSTDTNEVREDRAD